MFKTLGVLAGVAVLGFTLAGPAPTALAQGSENVVRIGTDVDAGTLDPRIMRDTTAYRAINLIYDGLVQLDENLQPVPGLAVSWENPDPKTWIFHLREGVKVHDGTPVTADLTQLGSSLHSLLLDGHSREMVLERDAERVIVYLDGERIERAARRLERGAERVAHRLEHVAAVRLDGLAQENVVPLQRALHRLWSVLPEPRRALYVREQEGHGPARPIAHSQCAL